MVQSNEVIITQNNYWRAWGAFEKTASLYYWDEI